MSKHLLKKNATYLVVGQLINMLAMWGLLALLARFGGAELVGKFSLALAIAAPVFMLTSLNLRAAIMTDQRGEYSYTTYRQLRWLGMLTGILITAGIAWLTGYSREILLLVFTVSLLKATEHYSFFFGDIAQRNERAIVMARSHGLRGWTELVCVAFGLWLTGSLILSLLIVLIGWVLVIIFHDRASTTAERVAMRGGSGTAQALLLQCLPLGMVSALIQLNQSVPRYFIEGSIGLVELGIFAAVAYFIQVGTQISVAFAHAVQPRMSRHWQNQDYGEYFILSAKATLAAVLLALGGVVLSFLIGEWLLTFLYGEEFAAGADLLVLLALVAIVTYSSNISNIASQALRQFWLRLPVYVISTSTAVGLSWWLIPVFGLNGAAYALAGSFGLALILNWLTIIISWRVAVRARTK